MAEADPAQEALDLVGRDPRAALEAADTIVATIPRPRTPGDVRQVATAHRAAGLALRSLGEPVLAEKRMRRGLAVAERADLDETAAEVRMSMAFVLLDLGRSRAALAATDQSLAVLRGVRAARVRVIRALVLQRTGRVREAFDDYATALGVLRRARDRDWEARLRHNRALLSIELGETDSAIADLEWTRRYDLEAGHGTDAADALFNIGVALETAGDVPGALAMFDRAVDEWNGVTRPELLMARVEAYLHVGLVTEATTNARLAATWLQGRGWDGLEATAELYLAACLMAGDASQLAEAATHAARARAMFHTQGRHEARDRADYLALKAALLAGGSVTDLDAVVEVAARLRETGGDAEAADLRVVAGGIAVERGDGVRAQRLLGPLCALERARPLDVRSRAWLSRALLSRSRGDPRRAQTELRAAWGVIEQQRARLGATELRSASAALVTTVSTEGARIAVSARSAPAMFDWAERSRSAVLRHRPVTPPSDPALAKAVARMRWASKEEFDALIEGEDATSARRTRAASEAEIVRLTRTSSGPDAGRAVARWQDVRASLGDDETFVQLLELDGELHAAVVTSRGLSRLSLGTSAEARDAMGTMMFQLRRSLSGFGLAGTAQARSRASSQAAAILDDRLAASPHLAGDGPLIVCPVAGLAGLPWPVLPSLRRRRLHVAPSAAVWIASRDPAPSLVDPRLVSVAGPGLAGADEEARLVAALRPGSVLLVGDAATPDALLAELGSASVLHIAAHGTFRLDNPLFSSIQLAGGAVTAYDLEASGAAPDTITLSACSSGAGRATVAEESLGFVWTLMGMGARSVVAPLLPVPDAATGAVMLHVHRALVEGRSPAEALAELRRSAGSAAESAVADAFVAYGV